MIKKKIFETPKNKYKLMLIIVIRVFSKGSKLVYIQGS